MDSTIRNADICRILKVGERTIDRVKKKFVEEGFDSLLERRPSCQMYKRKMDVDLEAKLVTLCCSAPPKGYSQWSLIILAYKLIELNYVEYISHVTVLDVLKNELRPWKVKEWVIPKETRGEFVANMEMVLDTYKLPYNDNYPVVCMDESPKQLIEDLEYVPIKKGQEAWFDYEYIRHGMVNIFMANESLKGRRLVDVKEFKTKKDCAVFVRRISDEMYLQVKRMKLVMDKLKIHYHSSLYETFSQKEAKRILDRFEFVYTPKHGSWLNMVEIELHVLNSQCLSRHIASVNEVKKQVSSWQKMRNNKNTKIDWQFTNKQARMKL